MPAIEATSTLPRHPTRSPVSTFVALLVTAVLGISPARAQIFEDTFDYPPGTDLTTTPSWALARTGSLDLAVAAGDLTYPDYNLSGGNQVAIVPGADAVGHTFAAVTSDAVFIAFLVRFSDVTDITDSGVFLWGGHDDDLLNRRLTVSANQDSGGNVRFKISKSAGSSVTPYDYALDTTYLLVAKYEIVPGDDNDIVSLYVNPDLSTGMEPAAPQASTSSGSDAVDSSLMPSFAAVVISGIDQSTGPPTGSFDNLRIGDTWDSSALPVELLSFHID